MVVAGRVTDDGAMNEAATPPVTGVPKPLVIDCTERLTSPVKVPVGETVTTSVCGALPAGMVRSSSAGLSVNPPVWTVTWIVVCDVLPPASVPVIFSSYVPTGVPSATFTVAVLDPPIATEAVAAPAKVAVMPVTDVPYSSVAALVRVTVPVSVP